MLQKRFALLCACALVGVAPADSPAAHVRHHAAAHHILVAQKATSLLPTSNVPGRRIRSAHSIGHMAIGHHVSHGRYLGTPDLALTSAMLAAGGGASEFKSATLAGVLAGPKTKAEVASLTKRFGKVRVTQFFVTFDSFVTRAVQIVTEKKVAVPPPSPALTHNGYMLSASLRKAGVMPDGRYDVGYMLEHLLSRPMHVALMEAVNADPAFGPRVNADFHVILTAVMNDLKAVYKLPA